MNWSSFFKSRTVWTAIAGGLLHIAPTIIPAIPPVPAAASPYVDGVLALLTMYFRANTKQVI